MNIEVLKENYPKNKYLNSIADDGGEGFFSEWFGWL